MNLDFRRARIATVATSACVCFAVLQPTPAPAWHYGHHHGGAAEALIGGAIGGIIGGAISSRARPEPAPQVQERVIIKEREVYRPAAPRPAAPRVDPYEREQTRNLQIALNYFGFDAGVPDGVSGQRTRGAISAYQAFMGFPVSGHLSDYERSFLTSSHARALAGGGQTTDLIATQGGGSRGLLKLYQQNQTAGAVINTATGVQPQPGQLAPQAPTSAIQTAALAAAPAPQPAPAPAAEPESEPAAKPQPETGAMPSFIGGPVEASMASFCNKTNLVTSTNGGMVTAATFTDAADTGMALGEQFCLARAYVMDAGERLSATVQGVTLAEMQSQCAAFAPTMRDHVAGLVSQSPTETTNDLQAFVIKTGMNPAQLSANARICLSIGYRTDGADIALASALVLVGLGEAAFGEVLGHHLAQGFGVPKRLDRAADWYDAAVLAMEAGAERVVAPGLEDRPALLQAAALRLRGGVPDQDPVQAAAPQPIALPSFNMPGAEVEGVNSN